MQSSLIADIVFGLDDWNICGSVGYVPVCCVSSVLGHSYFGFTHLFQSLWLIFCSTVISFWNLTRVAWMGLEIEINKRRCGARNFNLGSRRQMRESLELRNSEREQMDAFEVSILGLLRILWRIYGNNSLTISNCSFDYLKKRRKPTRAWAPADTGKVEVPHRPGEWKRKKTEEGDEWEN